MRTTLTCQKVVGDGHGEAHEPNVIVVRLELSKQQWGSLWQIQNKIRRRSVTDSDIDSKLDTEIQSQIKATCTHDAACVMDFAQSDGVTIAKQQCIRPHMYIIVPCTNWSQGPIALADYASTC